MADDTGSRRLMLHAVHSEQVLRGVRETINYEMNFHLGKDQDWEIRGFKLTTLEQEWVKRFAPGKSDSEDKPQGFSSAAPFLVPRSLQIITTEVERLVLPAVPSSARELTKM